MFGYHLMTTGEIDHMSVLMQLSRHMLEQVDVGRMTYVEENVHFFEVVKGSQK